MATNKTNGLSNIDSANITRFARDLAESEDYKDKKHLSHGRIRAAIMAAPDITDLIAKHKTLVLVQPGFLERIDALLEAIPVTVKRTSMTDEEREKFNKKRREAILETAADGPVNKHSRHALRIHYLQGFKGYERIKAAAKFDKNAVELE